MRRLGILVGILGLLFVGGALSIMLAQGSGYDSSLLPFLQTTSDAAGSTLSAEPWQAEQFFLLVVFILFNMLGIGATIAVVMWFLHRGVKVARAEAEQENA